jgi:hypothetical protein
VAQFTYLLAHAAESALDTIEVVASQVQVWSDLIWSVVWPIWEVCIVAAVTVVTAMLLRVGNSIVERYCSFEANQHGCATGQMNKAELGLLLPRWMWPMTGSTIWIPRHQSV